jgi:hypothetical protein
MHRQLSWFFPQVSHIGPFGCTRSTVVRGLSQFLVVILQLLYIRAHISVSFISGVGVKASSAGWTAVEDKWVAHFYTMDL